MLAVVVDSGHVQANEVAEPQPDREEVLVQVAASGITATDIDERSGHGAPQLSNRPRIPGCQLAGVVASLGPAATRFALGTRVMGIIARGAQAEFVAVPESQLLAVPEEIGWAAAAAIPDAFGTACDALLQPGSLVRGHRLLVAGACPGVTAAAIQIGRLVGAQVTAALASPRARLVAHQLGAETITPYEVASSGPYDFVLLLMAGYINDALWALTDEGIIAVAGSHGAISELNMPALLVKHAVLRGRGLPLRPNTVQLRF